MCGVLKILKQIMLSQNCKVDVFIKSLKIIESINTTNSTETLVEICFELSINSEDRPEIAYLLEQVNRTIKRVEMLE